MTELLARFDDQDWADGSVEAWLGGTPPSGVPVGSACLMVTSPGRLLLAEVRTRGWDLPGGHLDDGERPADAVLRELLEETGLRASDVTPPKQLGWFSLPGSAMLVFSARLVDESDDVRFTTGVPGEIGEVALFPLTYLPAGSADRIWFPFVEHLDDTAEP